ncbi:helix-turn-helix domain-containing protein [Acidithiobacillus sp. BN09-2]|nr:helix-turn-helix domain-containing protein [Acidithiobacillus sp. BN09-2]
MKGERLPPRRQKRRNPMSQLMRQWRMSAGIPQSEVAERLGVRQEAVANWEREGGNPPGLNKLKEIAELYRVDLQEVEAARGVAAKEMNAVRSPSLSFEHGMRPKIEGWPLPCLVEINPETEKSARILYALRDEKVLWRAVSTPCDTRSFFYQLQDDSMEPLIPREAWVAFDPMIPVRNGSVVLVWQMVKPRILDISQDKIRQTANVLIREVTEVGGQRFLRAVNSRYPMLTMDEDVRVMGVGIETHTILPR